MEWGDSIVAQGHSRRAQVELGPQAKCLALASAAQLEYSLCGWAQLHRGPDHGHGRPELAGATSEEQKGKWALGVSHSSVKGSAHDLGQVLGSSAKPASQALVWMRLWCKFRVIIAFPSDPARSRHPCIPVHRALSPQPLRGKRPLLQRQFLVCGERRKLQIHPCFLLVLQVAAAPWPDAFPSVFLTGPLDLWS